MSAKRPMYSGKASNGSAVTGTTRRGNLYGSSEKILQITDREKDFTCPVCCDIIKEAYISKCGHTFCHQCIMTTIELHKSCPQCGKMLDFVDVFPNYSFNELITKYRTQKQMEMHLAGHGDGQDGLKSLFSVESQKMTLGDVNSLLDILNQRKLNLEAETLYCQNTLLHDFLKKLRQQKMEQQRLINMEVEIVSKDIEVIEDVLKQRQMLETRASSVDSDMTGNRVDIASGACSMIDTNNPRARRITAHYDEFVHRYFMLRGKELYMGEPIDNLSQREANERLFEFRENLTKSCRYSSLRTLANVHYCSDSMASSTIVTSIVFDKDNEFFAVGGVTKRIKIYEYSSVIKEAVDTHYPTVEMSSSSKISCIDWNSYHKNMLASSDYEGGVAIWDVPNGTRKKNFTEHEKRCWSVDFNQVNPRLIASGSDDSRVKLWTVNDDHSVATLEAKANVCCVKFNPRSSCHLAFGSADHDVHYYDLRNMSRPQSVFKGHRKAVSYVKFLNTEEMISASTDNQLKLWNVNSPPHSLRSFTGHINEKNFVGLAADNDYIACGSEDNAMYVYYRGLPKPLFSFKIESSIPRMGDIERPENIEFVSAVCFRKNSDVVVAANSRGLVKVLEMY